MRQLKAQANKITTMLHKQNQNCCGSGWVGKCKINLLLKDHDLWYCFYECYNLGQN